MNGEPIHIPEFLESDVDLSNSSVELKPMLVDPQENDVEHLWPIWDPDKPKQNATPWSKDVVPLCVTLFEGDMLYLPKLWYHKVSLSSGTDAFCCSVNYW
jgi:hypothetical protein